MRYYLASFLCFCLTVSCGGSTDEKFSLANEKMLEYYESENVKFLSEAHDLYRQCEDGKNGKQWITRRFALYSIFADYDGARHYLSKLEDSDYPECLDPVVLETELELYESIDNNEQDRADSLLHQLFKRYAQLYKDTNSACWLQEMAAMYQECCDESQMLEWDTIDQLFNDPESFDLDQFLQLVDQSELSIEKMYQESFLKVRNELAELQKAE